MATTYSELSVIKKLVLEVQTIKLKDLLFL